MPRRSASAAASPSVTRLRMSSRRTAVAPMVERVLRLARRAQLSPERRENLAVALAEALSNAAVHGHRERPRALVLVRVETAPGGHVVVDVRDSGAGFDVASVVDPTDPQRLLMPGGRGVFLMRRLVDRLEYNAQGNHVRLIMDGHQHRRSSD